MTALDRDRAADRQQFADLEAAESRQRQKGEAVEAVRKEIALGKTFPGAVDAPQREFEEAGRIVAACKAARQRLKDSAPPELRRKAIDDRRALTAATQELNRLETELPQSEKAVDDRRADYDKLRKATLATHPSDQLSNKISADSHARDVHAASARLDDAKWSLDRLRQDIADKRSEIVILESTIEDNERALIEA